MRRAAPARSKRQVDADIDTTDNNKPKRRREKKKRESFVGRVSRQTKQSASLAAVLVKNPKAFPAELLELFRRGFRVVWKARGGGLYACGFFLVFVWLEIRTVIGEIAGANSIGEFLTEQLFEFFIRFTVQSIHNTVQAFLWPVHVIQWSPPWGFVALGAAYVLFANFLKAPLESWLFGDEPESEDADAR